MKKRFESSETFDAYTTIEVGYFMLKKLNEEISKPISPINLAVDKTTGYDKKRNNDARDKAVSILKEVIEAKKLIEADYLKDQEMIDKLNSL